MPPAKEVLPTNLAYGEGNVKSMDFRLQTKLEKRLVTMRRSLLELGKYGMSVAHYEKELAILEAQVRLAREELERARLQMEIPVN